VRDVQLIRMTPTDIANLWDIYAPGIEKGLDLFIALPVHTVMNNLLQAALAGGLTMWALGADDGEKKEVQAVILTGVSDNYITGLRSMWIYGLSAARYEQEVWTQGLELLKGVAKSAGCHNIQTFVRRKRMIAALEKLGADTQTRALTWRIE